MIAMMMAVFFSFPQNSHFIFHNSHFAFHIVHCTFCSGVIVKLQRWQNRKKASKSREKVEESLKRVVGRKAADGDVPEHVEYCIVYELKPKIPACLSRRLSVKEGTLCFPYSVSAPDYERNA